MHNIYAKIGCMGGFQNWGEKTSVRKITRGLSKITWGGPGVEFPFFLITVPMSVLREMQYINRVLMHSNHT